METHPERPWRVVASLAVSLPANGLFLILYGPVVQGLWELATFHPTGAVRPMALCGFLFLSGIVGMFVCWPLSILAIKLSERHVAMASALFAILVGMLPIPSFLLMYLIILMRGIELAS